MGVQGGYRARSAAVEWRRQRRPSVMVEREDRRKIFVGLEEIDNIIAGEKKIHPDDSRKRSESLLHEPSSVSMQEHPRPEEMKKQQNAVQRMHNGLKSAGETDSIEDQIHELTTLPQLPSPTAPRATRSPQFSGRAQKYRNVVDSSLDPSSLPELRRCSRTTAGGNPCLGSLIVSLPSSRRSSIASDDGDPSTEVLSLPQGTSRRCSIASESSDPSTESAVSLPPGQGSSRRSSIASESSDQSVDLMMSFPVTVSPPQGSSRRSSVSDSTQSLQSVPESGKAGRRFPCHKDLFEAVLTPRSRSTLASSRTASKESARVRSSSGSSQHSPLPSPMQDFSKRKSSPMRRPSIGCESHFALADEGCPMPLLPRTKASPRERHLTYKSLRLLIFGKSTAGTNREKLQVFQDEKGTKKQHAEFFDFWVQLDPDMFGEAKFSEFQSLLSRFETQLHVHHLQSQKITSLLLNRETGFIEIDDLIEALWPEITPEETAELWQHMEEEQEKRRQIPVKAPPLLPMEDRMALERIFEDLDVAQRGYVSFELLADARDECGFPLIDADRLKNYASEWHVWWGPLGEEKTDVQEQGGNRERSESRNRSASIQGVSQNITLKRFLLMMCPAGFRAFEGAQVSTHETGSVLIRSSSGKWHAV